MWKSVFDSATCNNWWPLAYFTSLVEEILHQWRLVVYPIVYRVLLTPGGCLGFLASTVWNYETPKASLNAISEHHNFCLKKHLQLGFPSNFPSSIVFAPVKQIPRKQTVDLLRILGCIAHLVGDWTNPFEKYARQIGSFPLGSGWKCQKYYLSCHHPVIWIHY